MACQAEDVVDAVLLLAPAHQRLAGEAAVRPQQDAHARPALADPGHDARDLLQGAGAGIEVRAAQLGRASMAATEHVERQVAVKEPALLAAVDGIVRGSAIAHDLLGRPAVAIDEQLDQQTLDRARVMADLVVARRRRSWCVLLPANGAQSRRRAWSLPASSAMTGSCLSTAALSTVVIAQVLPPRAMPNTRWPSSVLTLCATAPGARWPVKQATQRSTRRMARSAAPHRHRR